MFMKQKLIPLLLTAVLAISLVLPAAAAGTETEPAMGSTMAAGTEAEPADSDPADSADVYGEPWRA